MPIPRRTFVALVASEAIAALFAAVTIADLSAHARRERVRGPNMWGFRGPARLKAAGTRVALVGGSAAYGYGVDWDVSIPYFLGQGLYRRNPPTDVVNLAAVGDGAASYIATLQKYSYLRPNALCIYDAYAGLGVTGREGARNASLLFRSIGYFPIVDDVLARRHPWDAAERAVLDPLLRDDASGAAPDVSCEAGSRAVCTAIGDTIAWALARQMVVAVVAPPYASRRHEVQQGSLARALAARFPGERRVRLIDMGRQVDVRDRKDSFDGLHLTPAGNELVSQNLIDPIYQLLKAR
jgi:hypothetical protein